MEQLKENWPYLLLLMGFIGVCIWIITQWNKPASFGTSDKDDFTPPTLPYNF